MNTKNLRKIIPQGYSRLLVIPLFWLRSTGIDAGDYVSLSLGKNNELIINPRKVRKNG